MQSAIKYHQTSRLGFICDMENLFSKFFIKRSYSFHVFAKCWQEMNFSHVFSGRFNENDLHEFIDECFIICLSQMSQNKPLERRIAGLYLLYSMYVKQPLNEQRTQQLDIKIRMTQDDLFNARQLYSDCHNAGLKNVCFFWFKLLSIGAIHFVFANRQNYGPSYIMNSRLTDQKMVNRIMVSYQTEKDKMAKIQDIHSTYILIKETIKKSDDQLVPMVIKDNDGCKHIFDQLEKIR